MITKWRMQYKHLYLYTTILVAIILSNKLRSYVRNVVNYSSRMMMVQLQFQNNNINIIWSYGPTADKDDNEIDEYNNHPNKLMKSIKSNDVTFVLGDYNTKVGEGGVDDCVGPYGLGQRNERGEELIEFCRFK